MSDKKNKQKAMSQTGMMPRSILEPDLKREPPQKPISLPEHTDHDSATTGTYPAVIEGEDDITNQDEAYSAGN